MKKEIPTEVKARIFALYLGSEIVVREKHTDEKGRLVTTFDYIKLFSCRLNGKLNKNRKDINECRLRLAPLSEISDEDAIEVAKIMEVHNPKIDRRTEYVLFVDGDGNTGIIIYFDNNTGRIVPNGNAKGDDKYWGIADFLRSRHYALPAFGYSVQDLTDSGVFKII